MAKQGDGQKRVTWEQRLARYRASGATIARFCSSENVSVHTFHYWAKRLRAVAAKPLSRTTPAVSEPPIRGKPILRAADERARIHISWGSQARISIPVDALETLRCVLDWLHEHRSRSPRDPMPEAFQQVIVATREKARV